MGQNFIQFVKRPDVQTWASAFAVGRRPFSFWEGFARGIAVSVLWNMEYLLQPMKQNPKKLPMRFKRWDFNMSLSPQLPGMIFLTAEHPCLSKQFRPFEHRIQR